MNVLCRASAALLLVFSCAANRAQTAAPAPTVPTTPTLPTDTAAPTAPVTGTAQQPQASGNGSFTLRTFVPEVDLVFTVTDGRGHFVTGLKQSDLGLLDDGKHPERVISFTQQANLPLRIGILLDTSNSIRSRFQFEQQAAAGPGAGLYQQHR